MNLEKQFRFFTDKLKVKEVPIGKSLLLLLFMGIPGKFIPKTIRYIVAHALAKDAGSPDYFKKVDTLTQILGTLGGFGAAFGFKNWRGLKNLLGETGAEALALGTLTGAIDAGFNRAEWYANDLTDWMSNGARNKILDIIAGIRKKPVEASLEVAKAAGQMKTELGALPEAASSAWRVPAEEEYAGPSEAAEVSAPTELGAPEEIDPVERVEQHLAEMSKV